MSTYLSAYTINLSDTVETGRTKIDYLISGDTSPFSAWSASSENQKYFSLYRNSYIPDTNKNYITYDNYYSGASAFNLIFNGQGNLIDTIGVTTDLAGGFNVITGLYNQISYYTGGLPVTPTNLTNQYNIVAGSGNTINNSQYSFISGGNNYIKNKSSSYPYVSIISSENSYFNSDLNSKHNTLLSAYNSNIGSDTGYYYYNFISGENNLINGLGTLNYNFIGNGLKNYTLSTGLPSTNTTAIINGQNNSIADANTNQNANLFGSNLTAVSKNYSHFENLYIDETLMAKKHIICGNTSSDDYLDKNYSYQNIAFFDRDKTIHFPIPDNDLQFLTLILTNINYLNSYNFTFNGNVACKNGSVGRFSATLEALDTVAYFFIWTSTINKWVMFSSNNNESATF
jgi:hypothetical protein